jgi:hypothetical protein
MPQAKIPATIDRADCLFERCSVVAQRLLDRRSPFLIGDVALARGAAFRTRRVATREQRSNAGDDSACGLGSVGALELEQSGQGRPMPLVTIQEGYRCASTVLSFFVFIGHSIGSPSFSRR